jgi:hypothetical protein
MKIFIFIASSIALPIAPQAQLNAAVRTANLGLLYAFATNQAVPFYEDLVDIANDVRPE